MSERDNCHVVSGVRWRFRDLCVATTISLLVPVLSIPLFLFVLKNEKAGQYFFLLSGYLLLMFIPMLLARKYHKPARESLGIRRGKWSTRSIMLIGIGVACGYFLLESIILARVLIVSRPFPAISKTLLSTLSISGFLRFILGPVSEEVYFRGFLYGYLRNKMGVKIGLLVQALVFSCFHLDFFSVSSIALFPRRFLGGILSGILYEASGTLYPAIIYHVMMNYLITFTLMN